MSAKKTFLSDSPTSMNSGSEEHRGETLEQCCARVFEIHETHVVKFITFKMPAEMFFRQKYDPVIDFQTESTLWLVSIIGSGNNGEVCFAITPDKKRCCAIKFFQPQKNASKVDLAKAELDNWERVYGNDELLPKCHMGYSCETPYLCMPYIGTVPARMRPFMVGRTFGSSEVEAALRKFTDAGVKQNSMRWDHIGFFPKSSKSSIEDDAKLAAKTDDDEDEAVRDEDLQVYITDLGNILEFEPDEDKGAWIQQSVNKLESELPKEFMTDMGAVMQDMQIEGHFYESRFAMHRS